MRMKITMMMIIMLILHPVAEVGYKEATFSHVGSVQGPITPTINLPINIQPPQINIHLLPINIHLPPVFSHLPEIEAERFHGAAELSENASRQGPGRQGISLSTTGQERPRTHTKHNQ